MAKQRDQVITETDIVEYLTTQDDFDLELNVYRIARELGLITTHGGTYEDPVTKKHRQYDIRASKTIDNFRISLAIECKSLKTSFPLLVSRIPRISEENFNDVIHSHEPRRQAMGYTLPTDVSTVIRIKDNASIYKLNNFVGKSTTQIGRNEKGDLISGDGQVFEKWSQALNSATDLVSLAHDAHKETNRSNFYTLILPILVISDNTLWVADYSGDGVLIQKPKQINETELFVDRSYSAPLQPESFISHLHIVTRSEIKSFLDKIASPGPFWQHAFATLHK